MKPPFEPSGLVKVRAEDTRLSGTALLGLMRAVLSKERSFRFQAPGNSMHPFIRNGDVLTLAPIKTHLGVGDIVAFIHPGLGKVVVHRIIRIKDDACLIKGDAIPGWDHNDWVPLDQILARVARIEREKKEVRFGLGPERLLIAFLSGRDWLLPLQANLLLRAFGKWVVR